MSLSNRSWLENNKFFGAWKNFFKLTIADTYSSKTKALEELNAFSSRRTGFVIHDIAHNYTNQNIKFLCQYLGISCMLWICPSVIPQIKFFHKLATAVIQMKLSRKANMFYRIQILVECKHNAVSVQWIKEFAIYFPK